ncbi:hypothetical protein OY671_009120 [Metschnikowia pulcherrima]|nr:hypothetical protein OY671_009120 [Metschnikowia pulcherrima]
MVSSGSGMGSSVPATSMAVMATVPRERSGMASATMNASRQTGMTIGIASLGALMSGRAIDGSATASTRSGQPDAQAVARIAVTQHVSPAQPDGVAASFADASAGGFHAAMAGAGAASSSAASSSLWVTRGARPVLRAA